MSRLIYLSILLLFTLRIFSQHPASDFKINSDSTKKLKKIFFIGLSVNMTNKTIKVNSNFPYYPSKYVTGDDGSGVTYKNAIAVSSRFLPIIETSLETRKGNLFSMGFSYMESKLDFPDTMSGTIVFNQKIFNLYYEYNANIIKKEFSKTHSGSFYAGFTVTHINKPFQLIQTYPNYFNTYNIKTLNDRSSIIALQPTLGIMGIRNHLYFRMGIDFNLLRCILVRYTFRTKNFNSANIILSSNEVHCSYAKLIFAGENFKNNLYFKIGYGF